MLIYYIATKDNIWECNRLKDGELKPGKITVFLDYFDTAVNVRI